ncbi:hypothetical protein D5086_000058 [Populus alba]|uniref:Uncharacterized protein n=1 Tax=Populus alba TaxID=43335 RepID=A0ACC4CUS3_POPAL
MYSDGEERLVCPTKSDRFTLERLVSPSCQLPAQPVRPPKSTGQIQPRHTNFPSYKAPFAWPEDMETYRCASTVLHSPYKMRIFTLKSGL